MLAEASKKIEQITTIKAKDELKPIADQVTQQILDSIASTEYTKQSKMKIKAEKAAAAAAKARKRVNVSTTPEKTKSKCFVPPSEDDDDDFELLPDS